MQLQEGWVTYDDVQAVAINLMPTSPEHHHTSPSPAAAAPTSNTHVLPQVCSVVNRPAGSCQGHSSQLAPAGCPVVSMKVRRSQTPGRALGTCL